MRIDWVNLARFGAGVAFTIAVVTLGAWWLHEDDEQHDDGDDDGDDGEGAGVHELRHTPLRLPDTWERWEPFAVLDPETFIRRPGSEQ